MSENTVDQWIATAKEGKEVKKPKYLSDIGGTKEQLVEKISKSGDDAKDFDLKHNDILLSPTGLKLLHEAMEIMIKLKDEVQHTPKASEVPAPKPASLKTEAPLATDFPGSFIAKEK